MNKHLLFLGAIALCLSACGPVYVTQQTPAPPPPPPAAPAPPPDVTYQTFYDQLSPYGQWVENPEYGYVWLPDAGPDFKPYATNGHWVYTDEGWAWDSGYPWGWATFHYGRWFFQDGYGWMWVPGNEWAPAWVQWRNSDDYYGWAPLGPNISINVAVGGGYTPPPHYWCFVPHQYVASPQVNNYYVRETNNVTIINRTTIINNTTVINNNNTTVINNNYGNRRFGGPDAGEVSRFSGRPVSPTIIRETRNPGDRGNGNDFAVYRPHVNAAPASDNRPGAGRPAPTRYQSLDNARPVNRASYGNNNGNNGNNGNHNGWDNQPNRTTPGYSNNPNNQPANNQPANNNPYLRPGAQQPVNNPPANRPTWNQPANNPPVNNTPANNPAVNNRPVFNQPANNPPANNPPANNNPYVRPGAQPANNPAMNNPAPARPVFNQPANNPPASILPTRNPAFNRPGNSAAQSQQNQARPAGFQPNNNRNGNTIPAAKPQANSPKPAPQQHNTPPQQKKDDDRRDSRP